MTIQIVTVGRRDVGDFFKTCERALKYLEPNAQMLFESFGGCRVDMQFIYLNGSNHLLGTFSR